MAKTDSGLNRYEIHFTDELMVNISKVAVEKFDAKIHHRSKKPELKETIVALLELALKVVEDDPDVLKKDNPYINTDYRRIILEEVNKLVEDKINPLQKQITLLTDKYLSTDTDNSDTDNKQITSDEIEKISISGLTDNNTNSDSNNTNTALNTNNITDDSKINEDIRESNNNKAITNINTDKSNTDDKQIISDGAEKERDKIKLLTLEKTDSYTCINSDISDTVQDTNNITDNSKINRGIRENYNNKIITNTKTDNNTNKETKATLFDLSHENKTLNFSLSGVKLSSKRFGLSNSNVAGKKRDFSEKEFLSWTQKKDPDNIKWKYVDRKTGYQPFDMSPEQEEKLKKWFEINIDTN